MQIVAYFNTVRIATDRKCISFLRPYKAIVSVVSCFYSGQIPQGFSSLYIVYIGYLPINHLTDFQILTTSSLSLSQHTRRGTHSSKG